jgi:hypothetical protein
VSKKRKHDEDYVLYGFACINERDGTQKQQCLSLCEIFLVNGSIKPAKPKEHLTSAHPENTSKVAGYLRAKKTQFEKAGALPNLGSALKKLKQPTKLLTEFPNKRSSVLLQTLYEIHVHWN